MSENFDLEDFNMIDMSAKKVLELCPNLRRANW